MFAPTAATVLSVSDERGQVPTRPATACGSPARSTSPPATVRSRPCWRRCPTARTTSPRRTGRRTPVRDDGFAVLRLDLRGTGSSGGIATDEYPDVERADLRTHDRVAGAQPWSNGRVGMFGTSYSGFNSLHMAAEGVPELGAVVAMYATDDRYTDDVHYCGGVLRAIDLIDYPLYMVAMNALPPVPAVVRRGWRDEWRRRIEATPAWMLEWLTHPDDDPMWRRGSIRLGPDGAGYERMACPTMLVAGWADGYRNNTFRTVEQYERNGLPWRMLAGPWCTPQPRTRPPGPERRRRREMLAFFDEHLRDGPPSAAAAPRCSCAARASRTRPGAPPRPVARHRRLAAARAATQPRVESTGSDRVDRLAFGRRRCRRRGTRAPEVCRGGSRSTSAATTPAR